MLGDLYKTLLLLFLSTPPTPPPPPNAKYKDFDSQSLPRLWTFLHVFILKLTLPTHGVVFPPIMHVVETHEHFRKSLVYNDLELFFNIKFIRFSQIHWLKICQR
jgi:hypothetical protein